MNFGSYIKKKRLAKKMGLRSFAAAIGEDAGNWCRIENGRVPAPGDIRILTKISEVLDLRSEEKEHVFDLAAKSSQSGIPADIKHLIEENDVVPILFRTIEKKKLSKAQIKKLIKRIKDEY